MSKVSPPSLLEPYTSTEKRIHVVEFVNENEFLASAYSADETDHFSPLVHVASLGEDQRSSGVTSPPEQRAHTPTAADYGDYGNNGQTDFSRLEGPLKSAVQLESSLASSLDESDRLQQRASTQAERKHLEKSPELKYQTFQKSANFDRFRPSPRSHFSSDAMSLWPLRSIEESRLLQHFIQNLAPWVSPYLESRRCSTMLTPPPV